MNKKKIAAIAGAAVVAGLVIYLIYRLVAALLGLVTGALDLVIGLIVVVALAALVLWMFAYARRRR